MEQEPGDDESHQAVQWENYYHHDSVLFAIDCGPSMHTGSDDEQGPPLLTALRAALRLMEIKLVSAPKDYVGIMLWNTAASRMTSETKHGFWPHSIEYATLQQVNVPVTFQLRQWIQSQMPMEHVFANALRLLTASVKAGTRRVFFVTNQDDPHPDSKKPSIQKACINAMKDYFRRGIDLEPFFIGRPTRPFSINAFYADILGVYDDGLVDDALRPWRLRQLQDQNGSKQRVWDSATKWAELDEQMDGRETTKHVTFDLLLSLGPLSKPKMADDKHPKPAGQSEWRIHVKAYSLVSETARELPVRVSSYGNEDPHDLYEVASIQHMYRTTTGELMKPETMDHVYMLCESDSPEAHISFTNEEIKALRQFGCLPGLSLLGFKDRSTVHFYENIKHAYFLYPSDLEHPGSKRTFSALLTSMLSKNKVALCLFLPRENAIPHFAVLLPQAEELDAEGRQRVPPGMHLITMPYADDIREPPHTVSMSANSDEVAAASKVIESFHRRDPFNPDVYSNPALQHHYDTLMAHAFGEQPTAYRDTILPDYALIERVSVCH
ncbi:ATP-dependent DNA helicase II subunit 1 [Malassezia caprae]|uniref:ATP-dependent DNA helicase II subunit 1 n=1 Tax=Malassezia caprae TaxID=1381934 RepID=A0AAF0E509_9BASI|nr:ATP-dependent DNA helicase II subunit 1 [Malassezia caprae]